MRKWFILLRLPLVFSFHTFFSLACLSLSFLFSFLLSCQLLNCKLRACPYQHLLPGLVWVSLFSPMPLHSCFIPIIGQYRPVTGFVLFSSEYVLWFYYLYWWWWCLLECMVWSNVSVPSLTFDEYVFDYRSWCQQWSMAYKHLNLIAHSGFCVCVYVCV